MLRRKTFPMIESTGSADYCRQNMELKFNTVLCDVDVTDKIEFQKWVHNTPPRVLQTHVIMPVRSSLGLPVSYRYVWLDISHHEKKDFAVTRIPTKEHIYLWGWSRDCAFCASILWAEFFCGFASPIQRGRNTGLIMGPYFSGDINSIMKPLERIRPGSLAFSTIWLHELLIGCCRPLWQLGFLGFRRIFVGVISRVYSVATIQTFRLSRINGNSGPFLQMIPAFLLRCSWHDIEHHDGTWPRKTVRSEPSCTAFATIESQFRMAEYLLLRQY